MRPDGTRVKDLPPLVAAIPYIMPKRYDAWNSITENVDEEAVKAYIRHWRREGVRLNHMSVIIAAYYRAVLDNPKLNYFVMNGKIYRRNHFCVSFVILKKRSDGVVNETALKVYLEPSDDIFSIDRKIREVIAANQHEHQSNSTDKFARFMFSVPGLPKFVVWPVYPDTGREHRIDGPCGGGTGGDIPCMKSTSGRQPGPWRRICSAAPFPCTARACGCRTRGQ